MNRSFKNVAFFAFMGFGVFYLSADFLLHQGASTSETVKLIYTTFDMPFFFSGGMYLLASIHEQLKNRFEMNGLRYFFWLLAVAWTLLLLYLNIGYESFL